MEVLKALKEAGRADTVDGDITGYAKIDHGGILRWYKKEGDIPCEVVLCTDIFHLDWQPYPEVKEGRPEKAGELWGYSGDDPYAGKYHHTKFHKEEIIVVGDNGVCGQIEGMIHNKNGWTLLYSPDPERMAMIADVERIEIEGVHWEEGKFNGDFAIIPCTHNFSGGLRRELIKKHSMKMILEIPKEKKND
jgi:hypothetical protein